MKKILIAITLVMISFTTACTDSSAGTGMSEAEKYVHDSIMSVLQKCGDDYYYAYSVSEKHFYKGLRIQKLKGIHFTSEETTLSEADKLNGVRWRGLVRFHVEAYKEYPATGTGPFEQPALEWSPWKDFSAIASSTAPSDFQDGTFEVEKMGNDWQSSNKRRSEFFQSMLAIQVPQSMSCEELQNYNKPSDHIAGK